MKIPYCKIYHSSSEHTDLLPTNEKLFAIEEFYCQDSGPKEHFSYCKYQLDIDDGGQRWTILSLVTNSEIPFIRTHYYENGHSFPCGLGEYVSAENEYTHYGPEQRNEQYPIVAKGISAIFLWDLEYDNKNEDFRLPCDDEVLLSMYYEQNLKRYLISHNTRKFLNLTVEDKEKLFLSQHIEQEKGLWDESTSLNQYPLLYEYSKEFVNSYLAYLNSRKQQLEKIETPVTDQFSHIPSVFDDIPKDVPVVFISYSWDDDGHKSWVKKLADDLRSRHRIFTILDQYNRGGYDLISFMRKGVSVSHRVLVVGTPTYKMKLESNTGGGVKFEDQLISIELFKEIGSSKFIPVLRRGEFSSSFSELMGVRTGYDFRDNCVYDDLLVKLAADIYCEPVNTPPALSDSSNLNLNINSRTPAEQPHVTLTPSVVKTLLSSPNGMIDFTELVEDSARESHEEILKRANYHFQVTAVTFNEYRDLHLSIVDQYLKTIPTVIRYSGPEYILPYIDAMIRFCTKPFKNGEVTSVGTEKLHFLAPMFMFHEIGLLCIKYNKFGVLETMMKAVVPAPNPLSPSYNCHLAYTAGISHWDYDSLNLLMESSWLYPYSHFIRNGLFQFVEKCFLNKEEFESCYAAWEHLFSLMFNFYQCDIIVRDWFPTGEFMLRKLEVQRGMESFYSRFLNDMAEKKDDWEPLKQGLFEGSYEKFNSISRTADEFYRGNYRQ